MYDKIKSFVVDYLIPRRTTDWIALYENEHGHLTSSKSMYDWDERNDRVPDGVVKMRYITWFGKSCLGETTGNIYEYTHWKKEFS